MEYTFVSYSRKQLYFVEAIVHQPVSIVDKLNIAFVLIRAYCRIL